MLLGLLFEVCASHDKLDRLAVLIGHFVLLIGRILHLLISLLFELVETVACRCACLEQVTG